MFKHPGLIEVSAAAACNDVAVLVVGHLDVADNEERDVMVF